MSEEDVVYWRTLALERERALDLLRTRLRAALALIPDEHIRAFTAALRGAQDDWTREPDGMKPLAEVRQADVATILDDLWARVAADRKG